LRENTRGPVVLAGHSTGAQAALRAALAAPDSVAALLLAGPTFAPQTRRTAHLVRAWARTTRREPSSGAAAVAGEYRRAGVRALTRYVRSGLRDRPEDILARVGCPVLLATGQHDHFAPPGWVRRLATIASDGRAVTVAGAHAFPYSHPDRFADLVAEAAAAAHR
ncbi:MAG TPA: alpha/beta hydrolase, partial [Catenuloplanes sp.]